MRGHDIYRFVFKNTKCYNLYFQQLALWWVMQKSQINSECSEWSPEDSATALRGAAAILKKWECSYAAGQNILRVSHSVYSKAVTNKLNRVKLDRDQLTRAALVASIHSALRRLLSNPDNVYGFMSMINHNAYFNGRTPLSLISSGDLINLSNVHAHIDGMKGAGW